MNSDSTAAPAAPDGTLPPILISVNRAVVGLVIGAALTFFTSLGVILVSDTAQQTFRRVSDTLGWPSLAAWAEYPEIIGFVEMCLTLSIGLAAIIACLVMAVRLNRAYGGVSATKDQHEERPRRGIDYGQIRFADLGRGLPGFGKPVAIFGWLLCIVASASAIIGLPGEIYRSCAILAEFLAAIARVDISDPIWSRIDTVGSDMSILVFVPAVYLFCSAEIRRASR